MNPAASTGADKTGKPGRLAKLKDLAARAGRWLGITGAEPQRATRAVQADRFDQMEWREIYDSAAALQELAEELGESHHYATDLLADVWTAAYKAAPQLRDRTVMDASRAVNHQVLSTLLATPEFAELRRASAGDAYASAMAVISQRDRLIRLLQTGEDAQAAAEAAAQAAAAAETAARQVAQALQAAAASASADGDVDDEAAADLTAAIAATEQADDRAEQAAAQAEGALAAAAPAMRTALRALAGDAAQQLRAEAELMTAWGVSPGELQRMDFAARRALAEQLATGRIGRFAELIGRFRLMATGERARRMVHGNSELVGITLGDDVGRLTPAEIVALGVPALRAVFAAKLAESQLMIYDTRGEQKAGKGAIIACIDCSGSMDTGISGRYADDGPTREAWAKACALALLDQARGSRPRRDFVAILFSSRLQIATFAFPADRPVTIGDVVEMTERFFGGGTDFAAPLEAAAAILESAYAADGTQKGDIVFITDGAADLHDDWLEDWHQRKHRLGFRVFGVAIAHSPTTPLRAVSDTVHTISDLTQPGTTREIFHLV